MSQTQDRWIEAEAMVRSQAWREGYESFRLRRPPRYWNRGQKALAYEYGRLTAAYLAQYGRPLPRVPLTRRMGPQLVELLAGALRDCVMAGDETSDARVVLKRPR